MSATRQVWKRKGVMALAHKAGVAVPEARKGYEIS